MQKKPLGSDGPEISVIGYGAWEAGGDAWGANTSEAAVIEAIHAALDTAIGWIDTAEVYGKGVSEHLVGRALVDRRDEVFLASKVAPQPEGSGFRPEEIRSACEGSLSRLGTDRIDLYQLHWPDETGIPVEDSWGAMSALVEEGKVRSIGVSNFDRALIERCEAVRHVDSLQQQFSMLSLEDRDLIRWCGQVGTGVVTYGPLGFGLLTDSMTRERAAAIDDWRRTDGVTAEAEVERALSMVDAMRPVATRLGVGVAQLALAWNWHQPGVTSAIAGSRDPAHVRDNAAAGDIVLDDATLAELEGVLG
jgi:aryl-alcohol dehydrogenase-like predicted oxidoreductase